MRSTSLVLLSLLLGNAIALRLSSDSAATPQLKEDSSEEWGKKTKPAHKPVHEFEDGRKPIFYAVIMGKLAYRHQVSLWLSSLRKLGGFKDEALIVTDKPACLAKTLEEAGLLGEKISGDENVDIYKPGAEYQGNLHIVKRPTVKSINKMKLEKARAFLNLNVAKIPHPVSSIVYTDEDIVIAKNLNAEFMPIVRDLETKQHTLALFRDTGLSAGELHTGIVVMFPTKLTDDCIQAWGKKLTHVEIGSAQFKVDVSENEESVADIEEDVVLEEEAKAMGPDQQALHGTSQCRNMKKYGHDGIKILPKPYFWLPTPGGMKKNHVAEFVHFTNTGRWRRIGNGAIKSYLTRIGIPENIDPLGQLAKADKACADEKAQ